MPLSERYDTKSGKRRETTARLSFNTACELGFRGVLTEWERLMGAVARRGTHFQLHGWSRNSNGRHFVNALKFVNRMDASLESTVAADETFSRLKEGNNRHASGNLQHPRQTTERRRELAETQHPFAIILSCSDSRVPPEIIFDQGLGDLFVCRLAANVIIPDARRAEK